MRLISSIALAFSTALLSLAACAGNGAANDAGDNAENDVEAAAVATPETSAPAATEAAPVVTPTVPGDPMGVIVHRLENGLTLMLSPNPEEPRIQAWITVRAGSAKDPADATGMAHYLEHMLFKGTSQMGTLDHASEKQHLDRITELYDRLFVTDDAAERAKLLAGIDAEGVAATRYQVPNELDQLYRAMGFTAMNAFTSSDQTSYVVELPANRLEQWARTEAHRFEDPVFRLFQSELEAVYEEMNQSLDSAQRANFEALLLGLFPQHPYGTQSTLGTVEHLKNPSITKMYEYFRTWYVPGNMCISLAGDLDPAEAIEIVERHFGSWETRPFPSDPTFPIEPLDGRRSVDVVHRGDEQITMAYLTVPAGHADADALILCDMMLDNSQTGLINVNLGQTQAVRAAGSGPTFSIDAGYQLLYAIPKPGQTLDECEQLLLEQVRLLREGAFTQADLDAVVTDFEVSDKRGLEDNESRVSTMTDAFLTQQPWQRFVEARDRLRAVTKADVVAAARTYLADDYVIVRRRNGEPDLPEVNKPSFTPVTIEGERHSEIFQSILTMPVQPIAPVFAVAGKDYHVTDYAWGRLYHAANPVNDVFDLSVHIDVGTRHDRRLDYAFPLVGLAGAGELDALDYKRRLYALGSSVGGGAGEHETVLSATGLDGHFDETVALMKAHFREPSGVSQEDLDKLVMRAIGARTMQKSDPRGLDSALVEYAMHGAESSLLTALSDDDLTALRVDDLVASVRDVWGYRRTVVYVGTLPMETVAAAFAGPDGVAALRAPPAYAPRPFVAPEQNRIVFLQQPGAQARVSFFAPDGRFDPKQFPIRRVYNEFMGGGMGSVVFQEVREARSLAYSVWTWYVDGDRVGDENAMRAGMSNQQDKCVEAVDVLMGLIRRFPGSQSRLEQAQSAIDESYRTSRLGFRGMPGAALTWDRWGLESDPREWNWTTATSATLADLQAFTKRFEQMPFTIAVMGDREIIDLEALSRFGEIEEISPDQLFGY